MLFRSSGTVSAPPVETRDASSPDARTVDGVEPRVGRRTGDGESPSHRAKRRRRSRPVSPARERPSATTPWVDPGNRDRCERTQRRQPEEGKHALKPGHTGRRASDPREDQSLEVDTRPRGSRRKPGSGARVNGKEAGGPATSRTRFARGPNPWTGMPEHDPAARSDRRRGQKPQDREAPA